MRSYRSCLQTDDVGDVLVSRRLFLVRFLPALQIPNFKTTATADERDFAFQSDRLAKLFRQNQPALLVGCTMLSARMKLPKKTRRSRAETFGSVSAAALMRENSSGGMTRRN